MENLLSLSISRWHNVKDGWNNCDYNERYLWLRKQTTLYPDRGDVFNVADVYARTPYHLLPNNVHNLITSSFMRY